MSHRWFSALAFTTVLTLTGQPSFAADPTLQQVYQAAEAGRYGEAQGMMNQVLRDHPNSAKAHYVEAELLAKQGKNASAKTELDTAERLQPGLSFAKPAALQELNARLSVAPAGASESIAQRTQNPAPSVPWGLLVVGLALGAAIVVVFRRRPSPATVLPASNGFGPAPQPYGNVGPMAPNGGGTGSGILGSLATGAAVGAGLVVGESLVHRMLDGGQRSNENYIPGNSAMTNAQPQDDMGGSDFGVTDNSSWDDSSVGGGDDWN